MKQPDLFAKTHARTSDPGTSKAAAASVESLATTHKRIVLRLLRDHPEGLTPEEISDRCGLEFAQVWRRVSDLKNEGWVRVVVADGVSVKRRNRSGRMAEVVTVKEPWE